MMRIITSTCIALFLAATVTAGQSAPAAPAAQKPQAGAAASGAAPAGSSPAAKGPAVPTLEPVGFDYHPEGRRDPFISLLRRGADDRSNNQRPTGLAGVGTAEVILKGTLISRGGYVGILQGSDNKSYIVRVGDKLLDGSVRSISADVMVILQQVNDPLSLEKQREVRKQLRQTEEAK